MLISIIIKPYRIARDNRAKGQNISTYFPSQIHSGVFSSIKSYSICDDTKRHCYETKLRGHGQRSQYDQNALLNRDISFHEIQKMVSSLKIKQAMGIDSIPDKKHSESANLHCVWFEER